MFRLILKYLGNINLAIWLLVAIALDLVIGSHYATQAPNSFAPLNTMRFQDWAPQHRLKEDWWIYLLVILMVLFAINTALCTIDRLGTLFKRRKDYGIPSFAVAILPSLVHIGFLVVIAGHAATLFCVKNQEFPLKPGSHVVFADAEITALSQRSTYWAAPSLSGIAKRHIVSFVLQSPRGSFRGEVATCRPALHDGLSIHLDVAGRSKSAGAQALKLIVKRDPGFYATVIGNALICILMLIYFPVILQKRRSY